ncbi:hypothetical protein ACJZ2D_016096 [Fusarium nematophilum]
MMLQVDDADSTPAQVVLHHILFITKLFTGGIPFVPGPACYAEPAVAGMLPERRHGFVGEAYIRDFMDGSGVAGNGPVRSVSPVRLSS